MHFIDRQVKQTQLIYMRRNELTRKKAKTNKNQIIGYNLKSVSLANDRSQIQTDKG